MEEKYRHEFKYPVTAAQIVMLQNRINGLLSVDSHVMESGKYTIRSLYFDDYNDRCFYENEYGTDLREKFRIRIYNASADRITLECKRKEQGKTLKTACLLTEKQARAMINGKIIEPLASQPPLMRKMMLKMQTQMFRPKVIVEYDRIPYVYNSGNVRVTFDMNISSSKDIDGFFDRKIAKRPVMPVGQHLMEVKYDEYLPDVIYKQLQLDNLQQTAYSKYYLCRKFSL